MGRFWTQSEIKTLREMIKEKCTMREIANEIGRSISSVDRKIREFRIGNGRTGRPKDVNRIVIILDQLQVGRSVKEITTILGLKNYSSIFSTLNKLVGEGLVKKGSRKGRKSQFQVTKKWGYSNEEEAEPHRPILYRIKK